MQFNVRKDAINPETGICFRNPSHFDEAEKAENQKEIVEAVKQAQRTRQTVQYDYEDKMEVKKMPGVFHLREMDADNLTGFFKALLRAHPKTIGIHLSLGEYPSAKLYNGPAMRDLNANRLKTTHERAEELSKLFLEANVTELRYAIDAVGPGRIEMTVEAAVANEEEYKNDKLFKPRLSVEFVQAEL